MASCSLFYVYASIFILASLLFSALYDLAFYGGLHGVVRYLASIGTGIATSAVLVLIIVAQQSTTKENENVHLAPMSHV